MHRPWRYLITLLLLYYLSRLTFELAGDPSITPQPVTEGELWAEFRDSLSPDFYRAFRRAVEWQTGGKPNKAWNLYRILSEKVKEKTLNAKEKTLNAPELYERVQRHIDYNMSLLFQ
jgi:hypothetical protein